MDARSYAKIVGVVVLLVGVVGLIMGDPEDGLLGFNIDLTEDIVHLATGGLLAYVGFSGGDAQAKQIVMVIGVVYLAVGVLGFVLPGLFGLLPTELAVQDNILHLVLGVLGIFAARSGGAGTGAATT
ncbi:MAG TPA: DUF4383 domain-containing protein [Actinomycetota bacterium]|nr:DUF4383 domain-containing protein [Actinomycetota bacterium]